MTGKDAYSFISQLEQIYDIVRLVDITRSSVCTLDSDGNITAEPYHCLMSTDKEQRCENCSLASSGYKMKKCVFANRDAFHAAGKYIEINGTPYILELVSGPDRDTSAEKYGGDRLLAAIRNMNTRAYTDSLTNVYNRRYYDERLANMSQTSALAVIDVDNFKDVNDSFGHLAGDAALREIARVIRQCVRSTDTLVRYGGDEFLLVIMDIPREHFCEKLEHVRKSVEELRLPKYPELRLTVSIGGHYRSSEFDQLFEEADRELYLAKRKKNTVLVS